MVLLATGAGDGKMGSFVVTDTATNFVRIFIIEGIITCLLGIAGYFLLVDFPDRAHRTAWKFLSEKECAFIIRRINKDRDDAGVEKFSLKKWAASGLDLKIWGFAMIFL